LSLHNLERKSFVLDLGKNRANDSQVMYWEAGTKYVAKMARRVDKPDAKPLLLKTNMVREHGGVWTLRYLGNRLDTLSSNPLGIHS